MLRLARRLSILKELPLRREAEHLNRRLSFKQLMQGAMSSGSACATMQGGLLETCYARCAINRP